MSVLLLSTITGRVIDKPYYRMSPDGDRVADNIAFVTPDADPLGSPVPVPDVPGAADAWVPAGAEGLPPRTALSPRQRIVLEASSIGDLALRTWVASVLATTVTPAVVATSVRSGSERDSLGFYAELAAQREGGKL